MEKKCLIHNLTLTHFCLNCQRLICHNCTNEIKECIQLNHKIEIRNNSDQFENTYKIIEKDKEQHATIEEEEEEEEEEGDKEETKESNSNYLEFAILKDTFVTKNNINSTTCIKQFTEQVNRIIIQLIARNKLILVRGIFREDLFRSKNRCISFERKQVHSPYLFYAPQSFYAFSPFRFHLKNIFSNIDQRFKFFYQICPIDVEEDQRQIYICGGHNGDKVFKACLSLDLSNLKTCNPKPINELNEARYYSTLVSTPYNIFILGGLDCNNEFLSSCEKYNKSKAWEYINNLNVPSKCITASFVYPSFIYIFGSSKSNYEKINLSLQPSSTKWELLKMRSLQTLREYGVTLQYKENEILIMGGGGGSTNHGNIKNPNVFTLFDYKILSIKISCDNFNNYSYQGSRIRIQGDQAEIISFEYNKHIVFTSIRERKFFEKEISF